MQPMYNIAVKGPAARPAPGRSAVATVTVAARTRPKAGVAIWTIPACGLYCQSTSCQLPTDWPTQTLPSGD